MRAKNQGHEEYSVPQTFRPKLDVFIVAVAILMLLCGLAIFISAPEAVTYLPLSVLFGLIFIFYLVYFIDFISGRILKRQYLELTAEELRYRTSSRERTLLWSEIRSIRRVPGFRNPGYIEVRGRQPDKPDVIIKVNRSKYGYISTDRLIQTFNRLKEQSDTNSQ